jgi:hypothetical protein
MDLKSFQYIGTPINLIPPEILSKIFLACTLCWTDDTTHDSDDILIYRPSIGESQSEFTSGSHLPWIEVTRVCRYWRSVALACPELWRALIFSSRKATKNMIHLSKISPLIVKASSLSSNSNWFELYEGVRMAIAELQRVSVLHLRLPPDLLQPLIDGLLVAAPKLQSLRLRMAEHELYPPFTLPETIFPSLRLLELTHCKFVWQSLPLHDLTHLELRKPAVPPSIAQILSFLREAPILETLILDQALSTHGRTSSQAQPRLFLPNLYRLTLDDSVDHCADLLAHLSYSAQTLVSFNCEMPSNNGLGGVFDAIQSAAGYGENDHVIYALGLSLQHNFYLRKNQSTFRCWVNLRHSTPLQHSEQPEQLTFILSAPFGDRHFLARTLRAAGAAICLTDVQTFHMGPALDQYEVDWPFFLRLLPNVHTILFQKEIPIGLGQVLANNGIEETKLNVLITPLLPRLRSLWFIEVSFEVHQDALWTFFQSRLQSGVAIEHIHLRDCWEFSEDDATKLKEFVQDVDWDGIERYASISASAGSSP